MSKQQQMLIYNIQSPENNDLLSYYYLLCYSVQKHYLKLLVKDEPENNEATIWWEYIWIVFTIPRQICPQVTFIDIYKLDTTSQMI